MRSKNIRESLICIGVMMILAGIVVWISAGSRHVKKSETTQTDTDKKTVSEEMILWYCDSNMEKYVEYLSKQYKKDNGIDLKCEKVSRDEYLESVNRANISGEDKPDLYVINSEQLEKAYLGGLAETNVYNKIYNRDNYAQTALSAVTYNEKMVAYPFSFDTCFMVYNSKYVKEAPKTFDDILKYAENFDGEKYTDVSHILDWDVKDIIFNYGFAGNYLECGGLNGDDESVFDVLNNGVKDSLKYYKKLAQFFSIDMEDTDYSKVKKNFSKKTTVFSLVKLDFVKEMAKSKIKYEICPFPDLTDELKTKALSFTNVVVVNPFSDNVKEAEKIAIFMTEDNPQKVFDCTGMLSARKCNYKNKKLNQVYEAYEKSEGMPKLMSAMDYKTKVQIMLNNIWTGNKIVPELKELNQSIGTRLDIKK